MSCPTKYWAISMSLKIQQSNKGNPKLYTWPPPPEDIKNRSKKRKKIP